jgi:AbrB family looped-hinge helix DNA binding protein
LILEIPGIHRLEGIMQQTIPTRIIQMPSRGQITLPTDFRRKLGLTEGSLLQISLIGDKIEIKPAAKSDIRLREYTKSEISQFLADDRIDEQTATTVRRMLAEGAL